MPVAESASLFRPPPQTVEDQWLDFNGHMNMAFYNVAFDRNLDAFFQHLGIGEAYGRDRRLSFFTAEVHVVYRRELPPRAPIDSRIRLAGLDAKRVVMFGELYHAGEGYLSATSEQLLLHVHLDERKVVPIPDDVLARLTAEYARTAVLGPPAALGRAVMRLRPD
jgi:acyl-CoA thioester hydrolase